MTLKFGLGGFSPISSSSVANGSSLDVVFPTTQSPTQYVDDANNYMGVAGDFLLSLRGRNITSNQVRIEFRNTFPYMPQGGVSSIHYSMLVSGTTNSFGSGNASTGYSNAPLNYWNMAGSSTDATKGYFNCDLWVHSNPINNTGTFDLPNTGRSFDNSGLAQNQSPHADAVFGWTDGSGYHNCTAWSARVNSTSSRIDRIRIFPYGSTNFDCDARLYPFCSYDEGT